MKKTLIRMLVLLLVLLTLAPAALQAAEAATRLDLPIVYVAGKYAELYNQDETEKLYPMDPPIMNDVQARLPELYQAYLRADMFGKWEEFADMIYDTIAPRFEPLMMDDNGNPRNGVHVKRLEIPQQKPATRGYWLHDYMFTYDSRVDPYENARKLNTYINNVLAVTGKEKVNLIGRCLGTTVVATYLTEYGCDKVETAIFYASAFNGVYMMDGFFSGDIKVDYDMINYYLDHGLGDDLLGDAESIRKAAKTLDELGFFKWGITSADKAVKKLWPYLFPRIVLALFGTWPGHWAMISQGAFERAKQVTLANTPENAAKYAGLIEKVERYQKNVMAKFPDTLDACIQKGMRFAIFCKYNIPLMPLSPHSNMQADGTVEVRTMSLGATAADNGKILPTSYIKALRNSGNDTYLSPDLVIDASTCRYPENTWFIKNCPHAAYPPEVNQLFLDIFRSPEQYTIHTDPKFPQFFQYDTETEKISPIPPVELPEDDNTPQKQSFFDKIGQWFRDFFQKLRNLFHIG